MYKDKCEILILGAGCSGLAAASRLRDRDIRVLEARNRIGGRILTELDSLSPIPIELGAEFVHGKPQETFDIIRRERLGLYDVLDTHVMKGPKGLKPADDFWEKVGGILERLDGKRKADRSFADFLKEQKKESKDTLSLTRAFAEGFHAAVIEELSEIGLARAEQATEEGANEADHSRSFRVIQGYRSIPSALYNAIGNPDHVLLNRVVKRIHWRKDSVEVEVVHRLTGEAELYRAKRIIISIPLGVLASGQIEMDPMPKRLREAIDGLRMGSAIRMTFRFQKAFWENLADEPIGMAHAFADAAFPTWWTSLPVRAPIITGWAGGPRALEAYALSPKKRVRAALESLGEIFHISTAKLGRELESVHHHNWQKDRFSLGAYSFVAVNGAEAADRFGQTPVDQTLFFAGEATMDTAARGTVDGAIGSGYRAAELIQKQLREA